MRSTGLFLLAIFSPTLGSPFPEPEADPDPAYGVIKTIKIWDDDTSGREMLEDALELSDEEVDLNALLEQEDTDVEEPNARNLVGIIDGSGNFIEHRSGHRDHHDQHDVNQRQAIHHHYQHRDNHHQQAHY